MVSFTPCWPKPKHVFVLLLWLCAMVPVLAAGIALDNATGTEHEGRLSIDARFVVTLDAVHENALLSGVPLTFTVEFTLTHPRWYWAWRRVADWFDPTGKIEYRLSYHALTRQYRVSVGSLYQSFDTLSEALRALGVIRDWQIFERGAITRRLDSNIAGELSMHLDTAKLPKPLQLSLIGESEWNLDSGGTRVDFTDNK